MYVAVCYNFKYSTTEIYPGVLSSQEVIQVCAVYIHIFVRIVVIYT